MTKTARKPTSKRSTGERAKSSDRVWRFGLVMAGVAMCVAAGGISRARTQAGQPGAAGLTLPPQPASAAAGQSGGESAKRGRPVLRSLGVLTEAFVLDPAPVSFVESHAREGVEVRTLDPQGKETAMPGGRLLALVPRDWTRPGEDIAHTREIGGLTGSGAPAWIELTDGQRWRGGIDTSIAAPADTLAWRSGVLEARLVELDQIKSITFAPSLAPAAGVPDESGAPRDVVILRNGDRLSGFVELPASARRPGGDGEAPQGSADPVFRIDTGGGDPAEVPLSSIAEVRLANPEGPAAGTHVWLDDGTRLRVSDLRFESRSRLFALTLADAGEAVARPQAEGDLSLSSQRSAGTTIRVPEDAVRGVVFDASRITPLAALSIVSQTPDPSRRWSEPARVEPLGVVLDLEPVNIPGPMEVVWALPAGALRVSAVVALDDPTDGWGDCDVVVEFRRVSGDEAAPPVGARMRLSAGSDRERLELEVPPSLRDAQGAQLVIRVTPGASGSVGDRVRIEHGVVVLGGQAQVPAH